MASASRVLDRISPARASTRTAAAGPPARLSGRLTTRGRWVLRLLLALPFAALALRADRRGPASPAHTALALRGELLRAGGGLGGLDSAWPPLPVAALALLPGGTLTAGLLCALAAGTLFLALAERLLHRVRPAAALAVLAPVALTPAVWYAGSQDLAATASLAFLALALPGYLRFAVDGETEGGFVAGLLLAVALLCDPVALGYVVALAAAAPLLAGRRYRASPGAGTAAAAVLVFPSAAVLLGWAYLEWRFAGSPLAALPGGAGTLTTGSGSAGWPAAACLLYMIVAVHAVPAHPGRWRTALLIVAALGQLALAVVWSV